MIWKIHIVAYLESLHARAIDAWTKFVEKYILEIHHKNFAQ